jgi:hypothetical protein
MSAEKLEKLMFKVGILDEASGPASRIAGKIDKLMHTATRGSAQIALGFAGIAGAGYEIREAFEPALGQMEALAKIRSLGVAEDQLKGLSDASLKFASDFGTSSASFVASAYDIQGAIKGLVGNELVDFTRAGNVLAKATITDASLITNYMGSMYGIFKDQANEMGKGTWVNKLAGQTALAVQMFHTTGAGISGAFRSLGGDAKNMGVKFAEQMAVIGQLSASMDSETAASSYRNFLLHVNQAQSVLKLSFKDAHGNMLPIVDILDKIKKKYGNLNTLAGAGLLTNAFGKKGAAEVVQNLINDTTGLRKNIQALEDVDGLGPAMKMATATTDAYDKLAGSSQALKVAFGMNLLSILDPLINKLSEGEQLLIRYNKLFPNLSRVVGIFSLFVMGSVAAVALLSIAIGIGKILSTGWAAAQMAAGVAMTFFSFMQRVGRTEIVLSNIAMYAGRLIIGGYRLAVMASAIATSAWCSMLGAARIAMIIFNASIFASPLGWILLAIVAVVAATALLIYNWKSVVGWFNKAWDAIKKFGASIWDAIDGWKGLLAALSFVSPFAWLITHVQEVIDLLNLIPGVNIQLPGTGLDSSAQDARNAINNAAPGINQGKTSAIPAGGLGSSTSNSVQNNKSGTHVGTLNINTNQKVDENSLSHMVGMLS